MDSKAPRTAALACTLVLAAIPAIAQNVKVTPLGGFDGEFCAMDRALVLEDPNGTRLLYDPGRSVMGGNDPRLGKIDVVLVTHTHGAGIWGDVGLATGYVLTFSNGLVMYLSGDTGITAEQDLVVRGHYKAKLAVMNIGDGFTTGPVEAAYVINDLVKPNAVIPSHANEAGTKGGQVVAGPKTERFIKAVKVPAHVPLSGKTMEFNADGCVAGC